MSNYRMVVNPWPVILPSSSKTLRQPPRPANLQQSGYLDKFDAKTVFYDVFRDGSDIVLSGPPLLNLQAILESTQLMDENGARLRTTYGDLDRTQNSRVFDGSDSQFLSTSISDIDISFPVAPSLTELFAGRKVLFTKSKDNELTWIRDWASFHVVHQGIDALLIYDNGSTKYSAEDVLDCLRGIEGLETVVVVNWPFLFGPQGGNWEGLRNAPWDSDFCEYGILQHARYRFLQESYGVIHADVDELVVSEDGRTVFEILEASPAPVIGYTGRWIEAAGAGLAPVLRFKDFKYFDSRRARTTPKWSALTEGINDAKQWKTHHVEGVATERTESVLHRHFVGISSNWKFDRTKQREVDAKHFVVDDRMVGLLANPRLSNGRQAQAGSPAPRIVESGNSGDVLLEVQKEIHASGFLPQPVAREWYHTKAKLVFDYKWGDLRFAFDITNEDGEIVVQFLGRDKMSQDMVERILSTAGLDAPVGRQGKHTVLTLKARVVGGGADVAKCMSCILNAARNGGMSRVS
ncbi:hypothetical protein [Arthrobacter sp. ES3-54]|uniref:hypothetical protein n=1 Tax=Arthrobacter sp. ES3-54 TaxID=1502991 RepID=UPI00240502CE|nr:hypothetical protein [Arthrobacter sp. ES3-54]MDF9749113.1 hypothetical protein [Arthrobacter sp. ES3-54]